MTVVAAGFASTRKVPVGNEMRAQTERATDRSCRKMIIGDVENKFPVAPRMISAMMTKRRANRVIIFSISLLS